MVEADDDPGWQLSPRMLLFLVPGYQALRMRRPIRDGDGLAVLRQLWMSFAAALVMIGVVSVIVTPTMTQTSALPWLLLLAFVVVVGLSAERWALSRSLACDNLTSLAATFRTRFFLAIAFSESIALIAFMATIVCGRWWLYWIGMLFAAVGHLRAAPTRSHLETAQEELRDRGCSLSLVRALRLPPSRA